MKRGLLIAGVILVVAVVSSGAWAQGAASASDGLASLVVTRQLLDHQKSVLSLYTQVGDLYFRVADGAVSVQSEIERLAREAEGRYGELRRLAATLLDNAAAAPVGSAQRTTWMRASTVAKNLSNTAMALRQVLFAIRDMNRAPRFSSQWELAQQSASLRLDIASLHYEVAGIAFELLGEAQRTEEL